MWENRASLCSGWAVRALSRNFVTTRRGGAVKQNIFMVGRFCYVVRCFRKEMKKKIKSQLKEV